MKSIAELEAIRQRMRGQVGVRKDHDGIRVVVGMATCGIAAGARPVMLEFVDQIAKNNIEHAVVSQTGCVGMCRLEPIVDVMMPGQDKVTYVKMTPEKAQRVVKEHIIGGKPVAEYTIGAEEK